jgi:hypothetical protein
MNDHLIVYSAYVLTIITSLSIILRTLARILNHQRIQAQDYLTYVTFGFYVIVTASVPISVSGSYDLEMEINADCDTRFTMEPTSTLTTKIKLLYLMKADVNLSSRPNTMRKISNKIKVSEGSQWLHVGRDSFIVVVYLSKLSIVGQSGRKIK